MILTIQDQFTRWIAAVPLHTASALEVSIALLNEWFLKYAIPETLLSDNGTQFSGAIFQKMTEVLNVQQVWTSVAHPEANGRLERWHGFLKTRFRIIAASGEANWLKGDSWSILLPAICAAYNSGTHAKTGLSPYELVFAVKPLLPWHEVEETSRVIRELGGREEGTEKVKGMKEFRKTLRSSLREVWDIAKKREEEWKQKNEKRVDKSRLPKLEVGDRVLEYTADQRLFNQKKEMN